MPYQNQPAPVYQLQFKVDQPFGNLFRTKHVLVACLNEKGNLILGEKKDTYPEGIYRLIGGGVKLNETPIEAALREIAEELNIHRKNLSLDLLTVIKAKVEDSSQNKYELTTYLFKTNLNQAQCKAQDDITGLKELTLTDLKKLIERYQSIKPDNWFESESIRFRWADYAKLYAPIHQILLDLIDR